MKLEGLLYEIKINDNPYYLNQLLKNPKVNQVILGLCKRYRCRRLIVEDLLKCYIKNEYVYDENSEFIGERFVNLVQKYLGRRVYEISERGKRKY